MTMKKILKTLFPLLLTFSSLCHAANYAGSATGTDIDRTAITNAGSAQANKVVTLNSNLEFRGAASIQSDIFETEVLSIDNGTNVVDPEYPSPMIFDYLQAVHGAKAYLGMLTNKYFLTVMSNRVDIIETNYTQLPNFIGLSNRFDIVVTNYAELPDFIGLSNRFDIVETNHAKLPDFVGLSNRFDIVETNYPFLRDFVGLSNRFDIVETNHAKLPDFVGLSNRFDIVETNYPFLRDFVGLSNRFDIVETNTYSKAEVDSAISIRVSTNAVDVDLVQSRGLILSDRMSESVSLPINNARSKGGVLNYQLYAIGGRIGGSQITNVYKFSETNWTEINGLPAAREFHSVSILNDKLYVIGGVSTSFLFGATNVFEFDGTNWTEAAGLPTGIWYHASATLNNKLYVFGGTDKDINTKTNVYEFNGTNWTEINGLPTTIHGMSAQAFNNSIYVIGGWDSSPGTLLTNVYKFDGTNFLEVNGLPKALSVTYSAAILDKMYVFGGWDGALSTNSYEFDGTNWIEIIGLPDQLAYGGVGVLNNNAYIIGGDNGSAVSNVYKFGPYLEATILGSRILTIEDIGTMASKSTGDYYPSTAMDNILTNYQPKLEFLGLSNRVDIVETNYAKLPDFIGLSNRFESTYQAFTATITPDAGGTCTIAYANGALVRIDNPATNAITITIPTNNYPVGGVNRICLELYFTGSVALATATITNSGEVTPSATATNSLFFRRTADAPLWDVRK